MCACCEQDVVWCEIQAEVVWPVCDICVVTHIVQPLPQSEGLYGLCLSKWGEGAMGYNFLVQRSLNKNQGIDTWQPLMFLYNYFRLQDNIESNYTTGSLYIYVCGRRDVYHAISLS